MEPIDDGADEGFDPIDPIRLGDEVKARLELWRPCFEIRDAVEERTLVQLVTESVRVDLCQALEDQRRAESIRRARMSWDRDRMAEVLEIVQKLPRNPERWRNELLGTEQGCRWMIGQWEGLREILEAGTPWDDRQRSRALDLLGVPTLFREGKTPLDLSSDALIRRVDAQVQFLRDLVERANGPLDQSARADAEAGLAFDVSREAQALRRYEAGCQRRFYGLFAKLKRKPAPAASATEPTRAERRETTRSRPTPNETERLSVPAANPARPEPIPSAAPVLTGNRRERRRAEALARSRRR